MIDTERMWSEAAQNSNRQEINPSKNNSLASQPPKNQPVNKTTCHQMWGQQARFFLFLKHSAECPLSE